MVSHDMDSEVWNGYQWNGIIEEKREMFKVVEIGQDK